MGQSARQVLDGVVYAAWGRAGLVWAPCAGPVLALVLVLTGAALHGPSVETLLLLVTYGLGAATSLGAGVLLGGRLLAIARRSARWGDRVRRVLGAAVVAGTMIIWTGLDTSLLTRWSSDTTYGLEKNLILDLRESGAMVVGSASAAVPVLSGPLSALLGARQWLNTAPLQPSDLLGRVVLVSFWTYSCINCLRALPYVRAWAYKYRDRGLVVIGVHAPEFAFEKGVANVIKTAGTLGISFPVALDSDFRIWRTFGNQAWPALYFIGADGGIRHRVLGEGRYKQSEQLIQQLLGEAYAAPVPAKNEPIAGQGAQAASDETELGSAETYLIYAQGSNFASLGGMPDDVPRRYQMPPSLSLNHWGLKGTWTVGAEFATLNLQSGSIVHRFHARDLHLVMAPASPNQTIRFRITLDGYPPGTDHGADVDPDGWGSVRASRLYQLVRQAGPVKDMTFEIVFIDAGVRAYSFTFG